MKEKLPPVPAKNMLTYETYLKVPEITQLQIPQSEPAHHDEMLFIVIHQAYELWFKLILHELEQAQIYMNQGKIFSSHHFTKRVVEIMRLLVKQIHILETMSPVDFLHFRDSVSPASGFQSAQFRELEFLMGIRDERYLEFFKHLPDIYKRVEKRLKSESIAESFYNLLRKNGIAVPKDAYQRDLSENEADRDPTIKALTPVYEDPGSFYPIYLICETMLDLDQELRFWRQHHVQVVERILGFKMGTGGSSGVGYLKSTTGKKCFPTLWELRATLKKPS